LKKLLSIILLLLIVCAAYADPPDVTETADDDAEETVWIAASGAGQRYHYENCRTLRGGGREVSISEARSQGLTPCGTCRRQPRNAEPHSVDIKPNSLHFVRVMRVIDGDTITVEFQNGTRPERLRLIGVDTPETRHPQRGVEFYGKEASAFTTESLENRHVWLQFDVGIRDRFQRYLGYIWTEKPQNIDDEEEIRDKMFNARLLLKGYGQVMTIQPNSRYASLFVEFQREAREENRGLWKQTP